MEMSDFRLDGKVAWVTGASYGIGFAIATALAKAGAKIIFNDLNPEKCEMGRKAYEAVGIDAYGEVCDVTKEEQVVEFLKTIVAKFGHIDILVNNAGIIKRIPMTEMSTADFRAVVDVDLVAPFIVSKAVIPYMIAREIGKKDYERAQKLASTVFAYVTVIALLTCAIVIPLSEPLLRMMGVVEESIQVGKYYFMGYPRKDGRVGIRNDLFIVPTVGCVNGSSNLIKATFLKKHPEMSGHVQVLVHPYGCSQLGDDLATTQKLLIGLAKNPDAGATLVVGLGCENNRLSSFMNAMEPYDHVCPESFKTSCR